MSDIYDKLRQKVNYDEDKVPQYTISSPLIKSDGSIVKNAWEWMNFQRQTILDLYENEVYGKIPPHPKNMSFELLSCQNDALNGSAIRKEIRIHFSNNKSRKYFIDMLLYIPVKAEKPVPVFLGLNFNGNRTTTAEGNVQDSNQRLNELGIDNEYGVGQSANRWLFEETISRGYASATICYHEIFPNSGDWGQSIYSLFLDELELSYIKDNFSAISAWAWGLSRALDCLESEVMIDAARVALHGHSRLGKVALWAGANDDRFKLVISNDSGCGGAAQTKRCFGESLESLLYVMPHWFRKSFSQYINNEATMPFDQHFLISLIAPRPVCIASATEDLWADPKGEFLSGVYASEVYQLFGAIGLGADVMPPPDTPITGEISYHLRTGKHGQILEDWQHYWELADKFL